MINGLVSLVAHGIAEFESHYNGFKQVPWSHISSSDDQGPPVFPELGHNRGSLPTDYFGLANLQCKVLYMEQGSDVNFYTATETTSKEIP
ncbi:hypothetical protein Bca4012_076778 [Brassica carinata]|uniref:Uncharacterized protein n=1 Tax=Brassica oleracea TaxID=3712 RepID=A0A3P6DXF8_BRAOL|nr:unnamed protein product [Brassica oleracea]